MAPHFRGSRTLITSDSSANQYASRRNMPKEEKIHYLKRNEQGGEINSRHGREFDWSKI